MKFNIPTKVVLSVVLAILVAFGIVTYFFTKELQKNALSLIESHTETLAYAILGYIQNEEAKIPYTIHNFNQLSGDLTKKCQRFYELNKNQNITYIAIIDYRGTILAHNDKTFIGNIIESQMVLKNLGWRKKITVLDDMIYHTLVPLVSSEDIYLGLIDIGYSKAVLDTSLDQFLAKIIRILGVCLLLTSFVVLGSVYLLVTRPIRYLVHVGSRITQGHLIDSIQFAERGDEMALLGDVFVSLSQYLREVTDLATLVAIGDLRRQVQRRSKRDVLGHALQDMLEYLQTVATFAKKIGEGDLTMTIPLRADNDAFGRALQRMMIYLRKMATMATAISTGDLREQISPRSEQDVLGMAFYRMEAYLTRIATATTTIAAGDLRQDIQPESEHDVLGNAFHKMAGQLRENFERIQAQITQIQQEVTERKRAQEALQKLNEQLLEERNLLRALIDNLPDLIYVKDTESRFLLANTAVLRGVGMTKPGEIVGKTDFDLLSPDLVDQYYAGEREVLESGHPLINREELIRDIKTGTERWILTTKAPFRDSHGDIAGLVGISRDITELKRVQEELQALNEELEERVKKRTRQLEEAHQEIMRLEKEALEIQMAGGFAHEMRNALTGTQLVLNVVLRGSETLCQKNEETLEKLYDLLEPYIPETSQDKVIRYCQTIEEHEESLDNVLRMIERYTTRALDVTTSILNYARLGRTEAGREQVNLSEILEHLVQEHAVVFANQGINLALSGSAANVLTAHPSHLHSIFNNLVLNACDALLKVKDDRERVVQLTLREDNERVIVKVSDNANGIAEKNLSEIFKPFFSTNPTTGVGLGLSFVSKLVMLYHGTIDVESKVGQGTTFTLTFPISPPVT